MPCHFIYSFTLSKKKRTMSTLEIRAALRLTGGDVVAAAEVLASGKLTDEINRLKKLRDEKRTAKSRKTSDRQKGAPQTRRWTAADFVAALSSSSDSSDDDDRIPNNAIVLDAPPRPDAILARIRGKPSQRRNSDISVFGDRPQTDAPLLPPDIMNLIRPYVESNERNEPEVMYPPETHFAYHSYFEPYRGPPPFDSRNSRYEFLRGSTWVDPYGYTETAATLKSLKAGPDGKLWGEFEFHPPGEDSKIAQIRLSRKYGILSADELIWDQERERYHFNVALTMECASAVAMQIPEIGIVENDGTVVRAPVTMQPVTTPSRTLLGSYIDPIPPFTEHWFEISFEGSTVKTTGNELLPHGARKNIERVLKHCRAKQRPMRSITQGLRMRNDDQPPIGERVRPLTSEDITDDDYLPLALWESPSKVAFRKSLLGHLDRKTLDGLKEHQFASFDALEALPLAGARDIFWIYGRGFFIRTPATPRQRTARFTRIRSVVVTTVWPDASYIVAPAYPIEEIGKDKTIRDITRNAADVTPFVIDTPLPDGSLFSHGVARLVDEDELSRYPAEKDPIDWDVDEVVERIRLGR
jgi:hypothetical protein